jgi:hypothetical protein
MIGTEYFRKGDCRKRRWHFVSLILLLILAIATTPGCLKVMQHAIDENDESTDPSLSTSKNITQTLSAQKPTATSTRPGILPPLPLYGHGSKPITLSPSTTPGLDAGSFPDLVSAALPELPPDPYPVQYAMKINTSAEPLHHVRVAEFKRTYVLRGNSTGLIVNATVLKGPLWIYFDVEPLYDCLDDVASCRGDEAKTISRPYFTLTVRNNQTREIVAEDGYGREYSSQKGNRTIKIYEEGWYHLTLTGNSVDVTLAVATGAAVNGTTIQDVSAATGSSDKKATSPDILRHLMGVG